MSLWIKIEKKMLAFAVTKCSVQHIHRTRLRKSPTDPGTSSSLISAFCPSTFPYIMQKQSGHFCSCIFLCHLNLVIFQQAFPPEHQTKSTELLWSKSVSLSPSMPSWSKRSEVLSKFLPFQTTWDFSSLQSKQRFREDFKVDSKFESNSVYLIITGFLC